MKKFDVIYFDVATMKTVDAKIFTAFTRKGAHKKALDYMKANIGDWEEYWYEMKEI